MAYNNLVATASNHLPTIRRGDKSVSKTIVAASAPKPPTIQIHAILPTHRTAPTFAPRPKKPTTTPTPRPHKSRQPTVVTPSMKKHKHSTPDKENNCNVINL